MKIVCIDNFDRNDIPDVLICENVNKHIGTYLTEYLNDTFSGSTSLNYYQLKEDSYKLNTAEL